MSVRLRILSSVFEDIADAFLYYEDQSEGLGESELLPLSLELNKYAN